jgi:hypothetical protein
MSGPCLCGAPDCFSCGPAQGWHIHSRRCQDEDGYYACGQTSYEDAEAQQEADDEETLLAWQRDEDHA